MVSTSLCLRHLAIEVLHYAKDLASRVHRVAKYCTKSRFALIRYFIDIVPGTSLCEVLLYKIFDMLCTVIFMYFDMLSTAPSEVLHYAEDFDAGIG